MCLLKLKFLVRGVVYQSHNPILESQPESAHAHERLISSSPPRNGLNDPLVDDCLKQLEHDVELFKELGINTIFVRMSEPWIVALINPKS